MSAAMARLSQNGAAVNVWTHAPRMTEDVRVIVQPSPDLAYSSCVYDLTDGPVRLQVTPWGDYMSLSLFAANTDNFYTLNDRQMGAAPGVVILRLQGQTVAEADATAARAVVESPSARGVALIRRLAPSSDAFAAAEKARETDRCEPVSRAG
jgi:uncharacterized membrane protein